MDTEKKLSQIVNEIKKAQISEEVVRDAISRVLKISGEYDGYTSGNEDEEFFAVLNMDSKDLLEELNSSQKTLSNLLIETDKVARAIADKKKEAGSLDSLKSEDIGKINEILGRIEAKVMKTISSRTECDATAIGNREKLSQHDLENKL